MTFNQGFLFILITELTLKASVCVCYVVPESANKYGFVERIKSRTAGSKVAKL